MPLMSAELEAQEVQSRVIDKLTLFAVRLKYPRRKGNFPLNSSNQRTDYKTEVRAKTNKPQHLECWVSYRRAVLNGIQNRIMQLSILGPTQINRCQTSGSVLLRLISSAALAENNGH